MRHLTRGSALTDTVAPADSDAPQIPAVTVLSAQAADEMVGLTAESISPKRQAYLRFKQHHAAVVSVFVMALMILAVAFTAVTARYGVNQQVFQGKNQFLSPRKVAWFGTDSIGRDLYSRLLFGMKVSLIIGIVSGVVGTVLGIVAGAIAGLKGGLFDDILMRVTDIFLAFPILVALLVTRNFLKSVKWMNPIVGPSSSPRFLIILFVIFGWMSVARVMRAQVLSIKEREFIEAARAIGAKNWYIIRRHILPNSVGPLLVSLTLLIVGNIVSESTLALFGYGPDLGSGATSLGNLLSGVRNNIRAGYWWLAVCPFVGLLLITLCVSFIGDGLRDATDPKSSQGRA
jgi:peptide/nickel transport system permease protein